MTSNNIQKILDSDLNILLNEAQTRTKKRKKQFSCIIAALTVMFVFLGLFFPKIQYALKYQNIITLLNNSEYIAAEIKLADLPNNEQAKILYSYIKGRAQYDLNHSVLNLQSALTHFINCKDFRDSAQYITQIKEELYPKALNYFQNGDFSAALICLNNLNDYKDCANLIQQAQNARNSTRVAPL